MYRIGRGGSKPPPYRIMDLTFSIMDISVVLRVVEGADPYRKDLLRLKKNE